MAILSKVASSTKRENWNTGRLVESEHGVLYCFKPDM